MASAPVYVVRSTLIPGVQLQVGRAEYEHLVELGVLQALDEVITPPDPIVVQTTEPVAPVVGLVWFNPSIS